MQERTQATAALEEKNLLPCEGDIAHIVRRQREWRTAIRLAEQYGEPDAAAHIARLTLAVKQAWGFMAAQVIWGQDTSKWNMALASWHKLAADMGDACQLSEHYYGRYAEKVVVKACRQAS